MIKIRQNMMGNCSYVVVYYVVDNTSSTFSTKVTKKVRRFSASAIANKGYGYGEMACAKFLAENSKYIDGIALDINKTSWSYDEQDWLNVSELKPQTIL
jgi:hypothetical protein